MFYLHGTSIIHLHETLLFTLYQNIVLILKGTSMIQLHQILLFTPYQNIVLILKGTSMIQLHEILLFTLYQNIVLILKGISYKWQILEKEVPNPDSVGSLFSDNLRNQNWLSKRGGCC